MHARYALKKIAVQLINTVWDLKIKWLRLRLLLKLDFPQKMWQHIIILLLAVVSTLKLMHFYILNFLRKICQDVIFRVGNAPLKFKFCKKEVQMEYFIFLIKCIYCFYNDFVVYCTAWHAFDSWDTEITSINFLFTWGK